MIDAYIVRDPQGRVIGISVNNVDQALSDVHSNNMLNSDFLILMGHMLVAMFNRDGNANVNGYTLNKEKLPL
jgi:hypothetical protein